MSARSESVKDAETTVPQGTYEVLTLHLQPSDDQGRSLMVQIPLRAGRPVGIAFNPDLKEGIGHVSPPNGNARARIFADKWQITPHGIKGPLEFWSWGDDWGGSIRRPALVFRGTVDLQRKGAEITGAYQGGLGTDRPEAAFAPVEGKVTGTWMSEADLAKVNRVDLGAAYPSYFGKGDFVMPAGDWPLIDNLSAARFVWRSEEWLPTGAGSTSRSKVMNTASCNGLLGSPVLQDGVIYVAYFIPSGDTMDPEYAAWLEANKNADPLAFWLTKKAGTLYADDVCAAIDAATGKTLWRTVFKGRGLNQQNHKGSTGRDSPTPVVAGGVLYARGSLGMVYALDAKSGKPLWEYEAPCVKSNRGQRTLPIEGGGGSPGGPLIIAEPADGKGPVLVCGSNTHNLFALDAKTGTKLWEGKRAYAQLWIKDGVQRVLVAAPGELSCVEPRDGKVLWTIPSDGQFVSVSGDYLVMEERTNPNEPPWVCRSAVCYKMDVGGATKQWKIDGLGTDAARPLSVRDGFAYFTPPFGIHRVELATGKSIGAPTNGGNCHGGWLAGDKFFYVNDGKHGAPGYQWFDVSGPAPRQLWSGSLPCPRTTDYGLQITYIIADGRLFVRGKDGFYCFDLRAGTSVVPNTGLSPLKVTLQVLPFADEGDDAKYEWDLDDGATGVGKSVTHTYELKEGLRRIYQPTLTVVRGGQRTAHRGSLVEVYRTLPAAKTGDTQPGLVVHIYEDSFKGLPDLSTLKPVASVTADNLSADLGRRPNMFALQFNGYIEVLRAGTYLFALDSDDSSRLWIDGEVCAEHNRPGLVSLEAGKHHFRLDYVQMLWGKHLRLSWKEPGEENLKPVPADRYSRPRSE